MLSVDGIKKTHIMYRANLSHRQLEKYLDLLINKTLLAKSEDGYLTTDRGLEFIEKFNEIRILMDENARANSLNRNLMLNNRH